MSRMHEATITCPECGKESPFEVWDSVNITLNPEMKEKIKDGSLFHFKCPNCGREGSVAYDLLYHDMENQIMVWYASSDENADDIHKMLTGEHDSGIAAMIHQGQYITRLVLSQNELKEKIEIFDAGLDDRIVEIIKLFILAQFQENHMDDTIQSVETYYMSHEGKDYVQIFVDGKFDGMAEIPKAFYESIAEMYADKLPGIREDGPYINRPWAMAMLHSEEK